jgi:hypothetical protein
VSRCSFALLLALCLSGCDTKSGDAIVLEKEHIAAQEPTPTAAPDATPAASVPSTRRAREEQDVPLAADEIVVDQYVMKKDARGTSRDPRAQREEQWLVDVELTDGGRRFKVWSDKAQFERLKAGDRVQVTYRVGKYTRTVWHAKIK